MKNLIIEAENRINEIVKSTKNCHPQNYTAIYESNNGITISHIQKGWDTRTSMISFGSGEKTKQEIQQVIDYEKQYI